jgi:DhnA family fructose-bisphosphate aldolase class Ia
VVALDHAIILGLIPGTVDPARQLRRFVEAKADAILLNLGSIRYFADALASGQMPGLIARLDWTTALSETAKTSTQGF